MNVRHASVRDAEKQGEIQEPEALKECGQRLVRFGPPITRPGFDARFVQHYDGTRREPGVYKSYQVLRLKANSINCETWVQKLREAEAPPGFPRARRADNGDDSVLVLAGGAAFTSPDQPFLTRK